MSGVDLGDFLAHLGDAVKVARNSCAKANMRLLQDYLDYDDGDDHYHFRTIPVRIGMEIIDIPLFGLTPPGHLDLDKIEVEFDTVIGVNSTEPSQLDDTTGNPKFSISLSRGLLSRCSEMKVKACFSLKEPCETAEQIRDKLNKLIPLNTMRKEPKDG